MRHRAPTPMISAAWSLRNALHGDAGQALVEFAMILPMLLLLVLGVFEFARAWNVLQLLTAGAREGARKGVIATTPPVDSLDVVTTVRQALERAGLRSDSAAITVTVADGLWPGNQGDPVVVAISYPYRFLLVGRLLGWLSDQGDITLSTSIVMRKE